MESRETTEALEVEDEPRRRITAGPIIAIVVVILILAGLGIYFFYGASVKSVTIVQTGESYDNQGNYNGISVQVVAVAGGAKRVDGKGTLDVLYKGSLMHSQELEIENDNGETLVLFKDFIIENGVYDLKFSMGGKQASSKFTAAHVAEDINITMGPRIDPDTGMIYGWVWSFNVHFPTIGNIGIAITDYNRYYRITTTLIDPMGEELVQTKTLWEWNKNGTSAQQEIDTEYMGNYSLSAELENLLVKDSSNLKRIYSTPEEYTEYLNQPPEIVSMDPLRASRNVAKEFTFRATDPDINGRIEYFLIDWDASIEEDDLQLIEISGTSGIAKASHTFMDLGRFEVFVTAADNGYNQPYEEGDPPPTMMWKEYDFETFEVTVTLI